MNAPTIIARIGREATPAELGYQHARENPAVFLSCTLNLIASELNLTWEESETVWGRMSPSERDAWLSRTHRVFKQFIHGGPPEDGGEPAVEHLLAEEDQDPGASVRVA